MSAMAISANLYESMGAQTFLSASLADRYVRRTLWGIACAQSIEPEVEDATAQQDGTREEETLVAARIQHDPSAMELLYERYYDRILNYLYRRTMDRDLAEDLTSRTFLQAMDALRHQNRPVWVAPWLYRIATNAHVSHLRSLAVLRKRVEEIGHRWLGRAQRQVRSDAFASSREEHARVRNCLQTISEKYRTVLVLRYDEELTVAEIAEVLKLNNTAVRQRIVRGLRMLGERYTATEREVEKR